MTSARTTIGERARLLDAACDIARAAGGVIMPYFRDPALATRRKADASPVTVADEEAEAVILEGLARLTPGVPVVAEEEVAAGRVPDISGGRFWLVDPLDGTKEFLARRPEFTVNLALVEDRRPVLGVVYVPAADDLYAGGIGVGAYMEPAGAERRPIAARRVDPEGVTVAVSRTYGSGVQLSTFLSHYVVTDQITAGSSIKFCLIARGVADIYPRYGGSSEWDTAAGHAVLAAAGGTVTDTADRTELTYAKPRFSNPDFIAWGRRA
ncbi:MAG: 3'(2'),5'-bisphosphate nucleotidase CysQ [Alphaproteobacteria bacterium]